MLRQFFATVVTYRGIENLIGPAKVLDGDTIIVNGKKVRLYGIDAPELDQVFWRGEQRLPSGVIAKATLEALTAGVLIHCKPVGRDWRGRIVAKCFTEHGVDICRCMVSTGWALAYTDYSLEYVDAQAEARASRRGLWSGRFAKPWDWRNVIKAS